MRRYARRLTVAWAALNAVMILPHVARLALALAGRKAAIRHLESYHFEMPLWGEI